jgi:hypothetical protein
VFRDRCWLLGKSGDLVSTQTGQSRTANKSRRIRRPYIALSTTKRLLGPCACVNSGVLAPKSGYHSGCEHANNDALPDRPSQTHDFQAEARVPIPPRSRRWSKESPCTAPCRAPTEIRCP